MKIYVSNYSKCKNIPHYSISVSKPSWDNSIDTIKELVPKWEYVDKWNSVKSLPDDNKDKIAVRQEYTSYYFNYLKSLGIDLISSKLIDGMVLCCWCKKGEFCHRSILAAYLSLYGIEVEEL